jgi:uncharacterized protein YabN with tetrapyrrole methylase and pyrophosphatase domain
MSPPPPHHPHNYRKQDFTDQNYLLESIERASRKNTTEQSCLAETEKLKAIFQTLETQSIDSAFKNRIRVFYDDFKQHIRKLAHENKDLKDMLKALYMLHMTEKG